MKAGVFLFFLLFTFPISYAQVIVLVKVAPAVPVTAPMPTMSKMQTIPATATPILTTPVPQRVAPAPQPVTVVVQQHAAKSMDSPRFSNGERTDGGDTTLAPKPYCYVLNATNSRKYFYVYSNSGWQPKSVNPGITASVYVTKYVYLKIWNKVSGSYYHITAYRAKFYKIVNSADMDSGFSGN